MASALRFAVHKPRVCEPCFLVCPASVATWEGPEGAAHSSGSYCELT